MTTLPSFGNFNGLNLPEWDREMIESGFQAISSVEGGWDFLKTYDPPQNEGFMFVSNPPAKLKEIESAVINAYSGHSGASYGITMRILQYIGKYGWDVYAKETLEKYGPPKQKKVETMEEKRKRFLALPTNMTLEEQVKAIEEFKDVPMTYAELRARFG
jgi:hypothetical protein